MSEKMLTALNCDVFHVIQAYMYLKPFQFSFLSEHFCMMQWKYIDEWNNKCLQLSYGRDFSFSSQLGKNYRNTSRFILHVAYNTVN